MYVYVYAHNIIYQKIYYITITAFQTGAPVAAVTGTCIYNITVNKRMYFNLLINSYTPADRVNLRHGSCIMLASSVKNLHNNIYLF